MGMQDIRHAQGEGSEPLLHLKSSLRNGQLAFMSVAAADGRWISFVLTPIDGPAAKWPSKTSFWPSKTKLYGCNFDHIITKYTVHPILVEFVLLMYVVKIQV